MNEVNVYTDGASRGNPGPAAIGCFLCDQDNNVIKEISKFINSRNTSIYIDFNSFLISYWWT